MAELSRQGDELLLALNGKEKIMAVRDDIRVPVASIQAVEVLDDALATVKGFRLPGTGVPGVLAVGTFRHKGNRTFAVVHAGRPRGLRVRLQGADFDELVVGCDNPEELATTLTSHEPLS